MHAFTLLAVLAISFGAEVLGQNQTLNFTQPWTTPKIEVSNITCTTARKDEGICVTRVRCDYGTPNIDFTLYVPHGYKKQCSEDTVCCPEAFLIPEPEPTFREPTDFDFDDDD